jgi:hypothetical protein
LASLDCCESLTFLDSLDYRNFFTFFMDRFSQVLEFRILEGFRIDGIGTDLLNFLKFLNSLT